MSFGGGLLPPRLPCCFLRGELPLWKGDFARESGVALWVVDKAMDKGMVFIYSVCCGAINANAITEASTRVKE
jgi:hypothetical protein